MQKVGPAQKYLGCKKLPLYLQIQEFDGGVGHTPCALYVHFDKAAWVTRSLIRAIRCDLQECLLSKDCVAKLARERWIKRDQAKSGEDKMQTSGFLNQYSAPVRDLEKNFFAREPQIVLQHNQSTTDIVRRRRQAYR